MKILIHIYNYNKKHNIKKYNYNIKQKTLQNINSY